MQIFVDPNGSDTNDGTSTNPVQSLHRARDIARPFTKTTDVEVFLADGRFELDRPLDLTRIDGGIDRHQVTWKAIAGARPVISGGSQVTGWRPSPVGRGIYEADVTPGQDARQLWVNGMRAPRAGVELPRDKLTFCETGITLADDLFPDTSEIASHRLEVNGLGHFTDRWSPVARCEDGMLIMQQPAWAHNNWGFDTLARPMIVDEGVVFLENALGLLTEPGEWFLDPTIGRLYVMPWPGVNLNDADVVLPRLDHLLSISGSHAEPIVNLNFEGLHFAHTTWMGPATPDGYANQQTGSYLTGPQHRRPADALTTGAWGCPGFETLRNEWSQIPGAIQVSAAARIRFHRNVFTNLGQVALGIGNNPQAHASGVGLGAAMVRVTENVFTEIAGGAVLAGGICRVAHHPTHKGQWNCHLLVQNNRIHRIAQDFKDNAAILATYVTGALILHNHISDVPYDAVGIGWGWGINDVGPNPSYMLRERPYYEHPENLIYDTPTTHRDVVVAYNLVENAKQHFADGGALYNLSASPGTVIAENHIRHGNSHIGIYLDEGSRDITVRDNVVEGADPWLFINCMDADFPYRMSTGNRASNNYFDTGPHKGQWTAYQDNHVTGTQQITDGAWPERARAIMENAGLEADVCLPNVDLHDTGIGQDAQGRDN